MVAVGQADGRRVLTVEGLGAEPLAVRLQDSFLRHGAAQCGICTPGMLMAALALLRHNAAPSEAEAMDAIGGVLCRCTGYRKILAAICDTNREISPETEIDGPVVGRRIRRLDGARKVTGTEKFGADDFPADALLLRAIRSPYHRARFRLGDLRAYIAAHPGVVRIFTAADVPGENCYGVIPRYADQPVFAEREVRFRGEAVAAVVGEAAAIEGLDLTKDRKSTRLNSSHLVISYDAVCLKEENAIAHAMGE